MLKITRRLIFSSKILKSRPLSRPNSSHSTNFTSSKTTMTSPADNETVYSNQDWTRRWEDGTSSWHSDSLRQDLIDACTSTGKVCGRVFVPLCGATLEMKAIAELPEVTEVVGIELSRLAIDKFFNEYYKQDLYTREQLNSKTILHSAGKVKIYEADLFEKSGDSWVHVEFRKHGPSPFNFIFDRASLVAINWTDREKYVDMMMELLGANKKEMCYFLQGFEYPVGNWPGPPHIINLQSVDQLFKKKFKTIKFLGSESQGAKFNSEDGSVFCHNFMMGEQ